MSFEKIRCYFEKMICYFEKIPLQKFPWKSLFTNYIIHNSTLSPAVFAENCLNHTPISMRIFWCAWQPGMSYYMVRFTTSFCFLLNISNKNIICYFEKVICYFEKNICCSDKLICYFEKYVILRKIRCKLQIFCYFKKR